jgi:hypothetical protein
MSRGRAYPILKRSSHIVLILNEITPKAVKETKNESIKKPQVKNTKKAVKKEIKSKKKTTKKS